MGTSRTAVQALVSVEAVDGETNTHVRKQIQKLRISKGWTLDDLARAAGMAAESVGGMESGVRRINVDALQKIVEALGADITKDVWPSPKQGGSSHNSLPLRQSSNSIDFFRLSEVHSLTHAEASCMFIKNVCGKPSLKGGEPTAEPPLVALASINMDAVERELMSRQLLRRDVPTPWVAYLRSGSGRSIYLCLKNATVPGWVRSLIGGCLLAWLALPGSE